jgi:hypothetical protein
VVGHSGGQRFQVHGRTGGIPVVLIYRFAIQVYRFAFVMGGERETVNSIETVETEDVELPMKFTYSSGQRPLDGYTIKRGVGKGGFGEVYFGISDGGKEVALKLLQGNSAIEMRGVAQCLNLKHPNLVDLYDLKKDSTGDQWVIMEYISGETLNVALSRNTNGLPIDVARQWFLMLASAVGYLHDHGIVHRDLKPGNIFIENNRLKVGDYGLCKFIGGAETDRQSQSVGTVHYMAPEVASGNYNKQVDIYAAGIILYEMLTGKVPFDGDSVGEILMKHLTAQPDLAVLPADYRAIVGRALAKDPAHRFATMGEMARAIEMLMKGGKPAKVEPPVPAPPKPKPKPEPVLDVLPADPEPVLDVLPVGSWRGQIAELCGSLGKASLLAALPAIIWVAFAGSHQMVGAASFFFKTVLVCWAVLIPAKMWAGRKGDSTTRRLVMLGVGLAVAMGALWLDGWTHRPLTHELSSLADRFPALASASGLNSNAQLTMYLIYFGVIFTAVRWWKMASPRRQERFGVWPVLSVGFWGLCVPLVLLILPVKPELTMMIEKGAVVVIASAVVVQLASPWDGPGVQLARKVKHRAA